MYVTYIKNVDFNLIDESIKLFEGNYDFRYFMKTGSDVRSTIRTIYKSKIYTFKEYKIIYFEANGFLRSQVRMMVDFLLKIGKKELTKEELLEQLKCQEKHSTTLAPPYGLYLCRVVY
jgi:tRNA pseudouridine38-40 synthase